MKLFLELLKTCCDWIDLLLVKQAMRWKCCWKSQAVALIEPLLSKTLSTHTYKGHQHQHQHLCFPVNSFIRKYFFVASFHAIMRFQMFYKIDVLEILQNSQENACTRLSCLRQRRFPGNFPKFLETLFLQNTPERMLLISIQSSYCFRTLLFQDRLIFI